MFKSGKVWTFSKRNLGVKEECFSFSAVKSSAKEHNRDQEDERDLGDESATIWLCSSRLRALLAKTLLSPSKLSHKEFPSFKNVPSIQSQAINYLRTDFLTPGFFYL